MAYGDYFHCEVCDCKAFYDSDVCWNYASTRDLVALCHACARQYEIKVFSKDNFQEFPRTHRDEHLQFTEATESFDKEVAESQKLLNEGAREE